MLDALQNFPGATPPPSSSKPASSSSSTTHLPRFGRGLDVRDAVGAGQFLGLPGVHGACRQVTLVSHQHHGNVVRVLHALDLFSGGRQRGKWQLVKNCEVNSATEDAALPPHSRKVAGSILGFFGEEFACSPGVCGGSLRVLGLPHSVQKCACKVNCQLKIDCSLCLSLYSCICSFS